jgi:hypothetical protein
MARSKRLNNTYIKNPNALVFIYNYRDRLGDFKLKSDPFELDQIILNSTSLKAVTTQKSKANPAGAFEFRLAPTKDWVAAITPGSWCVILMSNDKLDDKAKYGGGTVDSKTFKMLGRIESVRGMADVDQTTGARKTEYVVTGSDWGVIFNSMFYVDTLNRAPNEQAIGMAERFGYDKYLLDSVGFDVKKIGNKAGEVPLVLKEAQNANPGAKSAVDRTLDFIINGSQQTITPPLAPNNITQGESAKDEKVRLPTSADNIKFLLGLWGREDKATSELESEASIMAKSQQTFKIPNKLARYMKFVDKTSKVSPTISQILKPQFGALTGDDTYSGKDTSAGIINFNTILGEHTMWQILKDNSNELVNELISEIRFEGEDPSLTLYSRIRPFTVNKSSNITRDDRLVGDDIGAKSKDTVTSLVSLYKNVKKIKINPDDVMLCSYGTNWRDRVNFIEVTIARTLFAEAYSGDIKLDSQFADQRSIGRDGLLSMMASTTYVPLKEGVADPIGVKAYKYILKEWHFNTHKMLNGTLNLIGQDQYIQVGDNIIVDSKVLNNNKNLNTKQIDSRNTTFMMAHVESVSHSTIVDPNGGRVFTTSINFVRGLITDRNGNLIADSDLVGALDQDTSLVSPAREKNTNTVSTSGPSDPDRQKLRGR